MRPVKGAVVGVVEQASRAVLVTLSSDGRLLDRREVDLIEPGLSSHPHHHEGSWAVGRYLDTPGAKKLSLAAAVKLVDKVRASAERGAKKTLAAVAATVDEPIAAIVLRECPPLPDSTEARIRDHRAQTYADSVMYRQALAAAARARGWSVRWYDKEKLKPAAPLLQKLGKAAGPPWRAQHKLAAAAALSVS
jgi:hypothetical protein